MIIIQRALDEAGQINHLRIFRVVHHSRKARSEVDVVRIHKRSGYCAVVAAAKKHEIKHCVISALILQ